jgi:hypothetical protein
VRHRALEVCIGATVAWRIALGFYHCALRLDALQLCEILQHACGAIGESIAFHQIATTVKQYKSCDGNKMMIQD